MICDLCKQQIKEKKERYVHLEDWNKGIIVKDIWMHLKCFSKGMNRELTNLQKQAKDMLEKAGRIFEGDSFNQIFPKKQEEYVVAS